MPSFKSQRKRDRKYAGYEETQRRRTILNYGANNYNYPTSEEEEEKLRNISSNVWFRTATIDSLDTAAWRRKKIAEHKLMWDYDTVIRNATKRSLGVPVPLTANVYPTMDLLDPENDFQKAQRKVLQFDRDRHAEDIKTASLMIKQINPLP